ncbi:hypothetical protein Q7P37_001625 [Cladosporium fusiforme]
MSRPVSNQSKLTKRANSSRLSSPPTDAPYPTDSDFDFPTLNIDGSVPDLIETHPPRGQRTPPAALSSLGLKMADERTNDNVNELNDGQYDMVDDVSDVSNDGNETVSITSEDAGMLTPDDTDSLIDHEEALESSDYSPAATAAAAASASAGPLHHQLHMLDRQHKEKLRQAHQERIALQKEYEIEKEKTLDSFLSEDLETPRQSTIKAFDSSASAVTVLEGTAGDAGGSASVPQDLDSPSPKHTESKPAQGTGPILFRILSSGVAYSLTFLVVYLFGTMLLGVTVKLSVAPASELTTRRLALSDALVKLTNSTNATKSFNIEHLLPTPTALASTDYFGNPAYGVRDVHFQGVPPNHIIVSLPSKSPGRAPQVLTTHVNKGDKPIAFNQTKLIDGVYAITLDTHEAYGIVTVNMPCKKPELNITVSHNFGRRLFHLPTYDKARSDLSTHVNKDVAVVRDRARSLTDRLQSEIFASIAATHNVTSQLVQHMSHEAHLFASSAASVLDKLHTTSEATTAAVRKDIAAVQDRLARAKTQVDDSVADVASRAMRSVMEPLAVAQDRAGKIRAKYFGDNAAREKVCKRQAPATNSFMASTKKYHNKNFGKSGELVEKKTCGSCDPLHKFLGSEQVKALGHTCGHVKATKNQDKSKRRS